MSVAFVAFVVAIVAVATDAFLMLLDVVVVFFELLELDAVELKVVVLVLVLDDVVLWQRAKLKITNCKETFM